VQSTNTNAAFLCRSIAAVPNRCMAVWRIEVTCSVAHIDEGTLPQARLVLVWVTELRNSTYWLWIAYRRTENHTWLLF